MIFGKRLNFNSSHRSPIVIPNYHYFLLKTTAANQLVKTKIMTDDNGCVIDWGDGSQPFHLLNSYSNYTDSMDLATHTYRTIGEYEMTIHGNCFFGHPWNYASGEQYYNAYKKIIFGSNIIVPKLDMGGIGFTSLEKLEELQFLLNPSEIPSYCTASVGNMQTIFNRCKSLKKADFPYWATSIGSGAFDYCTNLHSLKFGPHLSLINMSWADSTAGLNELDFTDTLQVPSFQNSSSVNLFKKYVQNSAKIYVPATMFAQWQASSDWRSISTNLIAV